MLEIQDKAKINNSSVESVRTMEFVMNVMAN